MASATLATISPQELAGLKRAGKTVQLIDVQTPVEFRSVHAEGARNLPLERFDPAVVSRETTASERLYFICQSGGRVSKAGELCQAAGIAHVVNVKGARRRGKRRVSPWFVGRKRSRWNGKSGSPPVPSSC